MAKAESPAASEILISGRQGLVPELVTPENWQALHDAIAAYGPNLCDVILLELKLDAHGAGAADVGLGVSRFAYRAAHYRGFWPKVRPGLDLGEVARRLAQGDLVSDLGLEYDCGEPADSPSVYMAAKYEQETDASLALFEWLTGAPIAPSAKERLLNILEHLPGKSRLPHLALMPSRPGRPLRACIISISAAEIGQWLQLNGWSGDRAAVEKALALVSPHCARGMVLAIDLLPELGPTIGVEIYANSAEDWPKLLRVLVDQGWADRERAKLFVSYAQAPLSPEQLLRLQGGKRINHLKLVFSASAAGFGIRGKGYVSLAAIPIG